MVPDTAEFPAPGSCPGLTAGPLQLGVQAHSTHTCFSFLQARPPAACTVCTPGVGAAEAKASSLALGAHRAEALAGQGPQEGSWRWGQGSVGPEQLGGVWSQLTGPLGSAVSESH